uniref:Uncharacterized protein n=1 Tax=Bionectria ochroleuca TaxID=29856 RepID=A0A8H7N3S2_BIOOC
MIPTTFAKPNVRSQMAFLKRDTLWESEKPYKLGYEPIGDAIPRTNHKYVVQPVDVSDVRQAHQKFTLDRNGFEYHHLRSELKYEDFFDNDKIASVYLKELRELVKTVCMAKQAVPLDAEIRRRHADFPTSTGEEYQFAQPSFLTHIDVTLDGTRRIIQKLYPTVSEEILKSRIECVTVWKPLVGPVQDWPLAVCDAMTLDDADVVPADVVYQKVATENYLIHHNVNQKWYYMDRQEDHEALLFKAADSDAGRTARGYPGPIALSAETSLTPGLDLLRVLG